jgi:putative membrane protein
MSRNPFQIGRRNAVLLTIVLALSAAGCAKQEEATPTAQTPPPEATTPAPAAMTDANIAAIVVAANTIDVENGELAKSKTKNASVKAFAEQMITDHKSVNKQATDLANKLSLTPQDNEASTQLKTTAESTRQGLKGMQGAAFDKAYVDNEVAYHKAVLDMLDSQLLPSAQNPELKSLLESVRPAFVAHLEHAQKLQSTIQ